MNDQEDDMDAREREQRRAEGFNEKGEILYDAGERDERNNFQQEKIRRRKEKDISEAVNTQGVRKIGQVNEYGLDDEEYEDIDELPDEEEIVEEEEGDNRG